MQDAITKDDQKIVPNKMASKIHGKTKKPINVPTNILLNRIRNYTCHNALSYNQKKKEKIPPQCQGPRDMLIPWSRREVGWKHISKTQQEIQLFFCIFSYHLACKVNPPSIPNKEIQVEHQHPLLLVEPQK
jgi:hypothetical protein